MIKSALAPSIRSHEFELQQTAFEASQRNKPFLRLEELEKLCHSLTDLYTDETKNAPRRAVRVLWWFWDKIVGWRKDRSNVDMAGVLLLMKMEVRWILDRPEEQEEKRSWHERRTENLARQCLRQGLWEVIDNCGLDLP